MTKSKVVIFGFSLLLAWSLALSARLFILWSSSHDEVYELINKIYINDQRILAEIESGNISKATDMLRREIEISGNIIAICAIEKCSKSIISAGNESP